MATTSRFPDWCIFYPFVFWSEQFDASTILQANSDTSHGLKFSIGLRLADPPLPSRLYAKLADPPLPSLPHLQEKDGMVVTHGPKFELLVVHRDALLLRMIYFIPFPDDVWVFESPLLPMIDYFIYRIDGRSRPSLERLPSVEGSVDDVLAQCKARTGIMDRLLGRHELKNIGFMRRGEEGFAVAEILINYSRREEYYEDVDCEEELPVLNVLRCPSSSSPRQWEVKRPRIIQPTSTDPDGPSRFHDLLDYFHFKADIVMPFGDYLCWVIYYHGILLCDVFADKPELRCLQLPALSKLPCGYNSKVWMKYSQVVSVTKGGVLKFVMVDDVSHRGAWNKKPSVFEMGFTVTSWTLRATDQSSSSSSSEPWEWRQDGFLTSDELSHLVEGFTQQHLCTFRTTLSSAWMTRTSYTL